MVRVSSNFLDDDDDDDAVLGALLWKQLEKLSRGIKLGHNQFQLKFIKVAAIYWTYSDKHLSSRFARDKLIGHISSMVIM